MTNHKFSLKMSQCTYSESAVLNCAQVLTVIIFFLAFLPHRFDRKPDPELYKRSDPEYTTSDPQNCLIVGGLKEGVGAQHVPQEVHRSCRLQTVLVCMTKGEVNKADTVKDWLILARPRGVGGKGRSELRQARPRSF